MTDTKNTTLAQRVAALKPRADIIGEGIGGPTADLVGTAAGEAIKSAERAVEIAQILVPVVRRDADKIDPHGARVHRLTDRATCAVEEAESAVRLHDDGKADIAEGCASRANDALRVLLDERENVLHSVAGTLPAVEL